LFQSLLNMTSRFNINDQCNHAAMVHFSSPDSRTAVSFNLMDHNSQSQMQDVVNNINVMDILGITDLDLGIQTVLNQVLVGGQDRGDAANNVIVFAEGFYDQAGNCCPSPWDDASQMRGRSTVYAVAVGSVPDIGALNQLTGDSSRVYNMGNYMQIVDRICSQVTSC